MPTKGLIFDMDGLLLDTEVVYYRANQQAADELGIPYTKGQYVSYLGLGDDEVWARYYRDFAAFPEKTVTEMIRRAKEYTYSFFHEEKIPLKKGAQELLSFAQAQDIPCVLASSNTLDIITVLLSKHQLLERFVAIVSADDVTRAKPDPEIVEKAAAKFHLPKKQLVMLEDSENGVLASHAAGVPVCMIPDLLPPTATIEKLATKILPDLGMVIPTFF
ncbi:HAD family hydrolase [Enterococcus nangangensis]